MSRCHVVAALALGALAALHPGGAAAVEVERNGDFYYDTSDGSVALMRHVEWPDGVDRRPMSHKEKLEMMGIQLPERRASLEPRWVRPKRSEVLLYDGQRRDEIYLKFVDETPVRLSDGRLRTAGATLPALEAVLAEHQGATVERMFSQPEYMLDDNKETGERISGKALADLNNFYIVRAPADEARAIRLANELLVLDVVEDAYFPALESMPGGTCADIAPATPSWENDQNYLDAAPAGIDAEYAWAYHAGGNGNAGFWVVDLEWAWCFDHEDLAMTAGDVINGSTANGDPDFDDPSHGTAVLGVYGACDGGFGMTGISSDVTLKMADRDSEPSWASNIMAADGVLLPGEVMLLEVQLNGPSTGGTCPCNCPQYEDVPVEWDSASHAAIETAVANGIVVVEAAGNGSVNLDLPVYGGWFALSNDSGAIMVGAAQPGAHDLSCFTNYGATVDVHGYGSGVYTTGYGTIFSSSGCTQDYTSSFGGTSSASPIVTGAAASLQGIANAKYGLDASPALVRSALRSGGTPQGAPTSRNIGPMPNMRNAINYIEPDVYPVTRAGHDFPVVPRSTADAMVDNAVLQPGPLSPAQTYWTWTTENDPFFAPTVNQPQTGLYVSDAFLWICLHNNFAPGEQQLCLNVGPDAIVGGRHTVRSLADYAEVEEEFSETNNQYARQFIWSPLTLTADAPVTRSSFPYGFTPGYGPYPNAEGFRGATSNYWHAFAVMPVGSDDFDVRLHTETPANIPQAGFGAYEAWSSDATNGEVDFVVLDRNTVGAGTYYGGVINYTGGGVGNKVVEWDADQGLLTATALQGGGSVGGSFGPFTIEAGDVLGLHELSLPDDAESRVHVEWISGNADYGISVLDGTSGYHSKFDALPGGVADAGGPGEDEFVVVTSESGGSLFDFHGLVVWKKDYLQLGRSLTYMVHVSADPNLTASTPSGWWGPIVPRNTTDATTGSAPLPATLNGNQATTSFNWAILNEGANDVAASYQTQLYVDDVFSWWLPVANTPSGAFAYAINSPQGGEFSIVRGGRHHVRSESDAMDDVVEFDEGDNAYTEWFVWTPLELADDTPVTRAAPPPRAPLGWGPEYSVDGVRAPAGSSGADQYWVATGVLSVDPADQYEARLHEPSTGSRNGFGVPLEWSFTTPGETQFVLSDFNTVTRDAYDVGVLNWNAGTGDVVVQSVLSDYEGMVPAGVLYEDFGPFELAAGEILEIHEIFVAEVTSPLIVRVEPVGGDYVGLSPCTADLAFGIYDGTTGHFEKNGAFAGADDAGPGEAEILPNVMFPADDYYGFVVYKTGSDQLDESCTYRISFSTTTVDAPETVSLPSRFELMSPRPNPFGATTALGYGVPAGGGEVNVAVFDAQGRRVATLVDGFQSAGHHRTIWDGRDANGRRAVPGVYFVRFAAPGATETRKITFLE